MRLATHVTPPEAKRLRKALRPGQTISDALRDLVVAAYPPPLEAAPPATDPAAQADRI